MKYVVVHASGLLSSPDAPPGGKSSLQAATIPGLDRLAKNGVMGLVTVPIEGSAAHSDLVHFAVLGHDPHKHYPGPAPFEAAGLGVMLGEMDVAYVCSMVTLGSGSARGAGRDDIKKWAPQLILEDPSGGCIETEQARELIEAVNEQLGSETIQFYPGSGSRHLMVWVGGKARATCFAPKDVASRAIGEFLPKGDGSDILRQLMEASLIILRDHPINEERREGKLKPANCLWLWGQGRWPRMPSLTDRYQITGSILSDNDLHKGVGICAGLDPVELSGEGSISAEMALSALEKKDLLYIHVRPPSEASESPDPRTKVEFIERFDRDIVQRLLGELHKVGPHRVLAICDSAVASGVSGASSASALYALYQGPMAKEAQGSGGFNEADAASSSGRVRDASRLLSNLLSDRAAA
jgi:2,3-bisphosphoglycerate-independent phosphoglycerate mutase